MSPTRPATMSNENTTTAKLCNQLKLYDQNKIYSSMKADQNMNAAIEIII